MKKFLLTYIFIFSIIVGCIEKTTIISDSVFETWPDLYAVEAVLIIPGAGCEGCIGSATQFAINYADSLKIGVVFTQVVSLKTLRFRLGNDFFQLPNVKVDTFDVVPLNETYYPSIVYSSSRKSKLVSPENPTALEDLKIFKK